MSDSLVSLDEVKTYCGIGDDPRIAVIHAGVEAYILGEIDDPIGTTTFAHERYDGPGGQVLWLRHTPVVSIHRFSVGTRTAITVINSSSDAGSAYAEVTADKLRLGIDGGLNGGVSEITLAGKTFSQIVIEINNLGKNWAAEVSDSLFDQYLAIDLIPQAGGYALDIESLLQMPDYPIADITVDAENGRVYSPNIGMVRGVLNIVVTYEAGLPLPADLKLLILDGTRFRYKKQSGSGKDGLKSFKRGNVTEDFGDQQADFFDRSTVKKTLGRYRRYNV